MSRYRNYGDLDDEVTPNGDIGFWRVRNRADVSLNEAGELAGAWNVRLDERAVVPRNGLKRVDGSPALANTPALVPPFVPGPDKVVRDVYEDGVWCSCVYAYGGDEHREYLALFTSLECVLFRPDSEAVVVVEYTDGETLESGDVCMALEVDERLFLFRGKDKLPLVWDGDVANDFEVVLNEVDDGTHTAGPGFDYLIGCEWVLQHRNRFVVPVDRWTVGVSWLKEWETFDTIYDQFQFEYGTDDWLEAAESFQKNKVIVGMHKSLHVIDNAGADLDEAEGQLLTREFGVACARGLLVRGARVFVLSDGEVYALTITSDLELLGADRPISDDVDWFADVNWDAVGCAFVFSSGTRIGFAVPTGDSERVNEVFWYNLLNEDVSTEQRGWECRDSFPCYADGVLRSEYAGSPVDFLVNVEGGVYEMDAEGQLWDDWGGTDEDGLLSQVAIGAEVLSRELRVVQPGVSVMRTLEAEVAVEDDCALRVSAVSSAGTVRDLGEWRSRSREFRRLPLRLRGVGVQLSMRQVENGVWKLRSWGVQGAESARRGVAY